MKAYPHLSAGEGKKDSFTELWKRAADEMRDKMIVSTLDCSDSPSMCCGRADLVAFD